jgi:hypothetical protein
MVETVGDLDNVFFEIANELAAIAWQHEIAGFIRGLEATRPKQHLILISSGGRAIDGSWYLLSESAVVDAPSDLYAVNKLWTDYALDPPPHRGSKPALLDMDHGWAETPIQNDRRVPWKAFTRGYHFNLYDEPFEAPEKESAVWENLRRNLGVIAKYANSRFRDLAGMVPAGALASTGYALANRGVEYLAYAPDGGEIVMQLETGSYAAEWFNPESIEFIDAGIVNATGDSMPFEAPFQGDAVLYLRSIER